MNMLKGICFVFILLVVAYATPRSIISSIFEPSQVGDITFTPAKLPCSFNLSYHLQRVSGNITSDSFYTFLKNGKLFFLEEKEKTSIWDAIVRPDLSFESGGDIYVPFYSSYKGATCEERDLSEEEADDYVHDKLATFIDKQTFISVNETVFQGKKCKAYYTVKDKKTQVFEYVDEKDYIIGAIYRDPRKSYHYLVVVSYNFTVPMTGFAMDRSKFPDCQQKAYSVPKNQC